MQKRRSHTKSRNGCTNCKQRHCDELGPPCANCIAREMPETCFLTAARSSRSPGSASSGSVSTRRPTGDEARRHRLEVELMHRWTSSTYKSLCCLPEDHEYLQWDVPRWGFQHDCVLQGVYALAALEVVLCGDAATDAGPAAYFDMALDCYGRGSASFRELLGNMSEKNVNAVYVFSSIAMAINLAIPECGRALGRPDYQGMLERICVLSELTMGSTSIGLAYPDAMATGPLGKSITKALEIVLQDDAPPLAAETAKAVDRLSGIVDDAFTPPEDASEEERQVLTSRRGFYENAVEQLRICFVEEAKGILKGFAISFPSMVGPEFLAALKNLEPLAIMVLMHWGVLLHRIGELAWWARSVGKNMVLEVSDALYESSKRFGDKPAWREGMAWARREVDLPVMEDRRSSSDRQG